MNVFWASRAQIVIVPVAGPDDEADDLSPEPEVSEPPQATTPSASAAAAARALMVLLGTALLLWWTLGPIALSQTVGIHTRMAFGPRLPQRKYGMAVSSAGRGCAAGAAGALV